MQTRRHSSASPRGRISNLPGPFRNRQAFHRPRTGQVGKPAPRPRRGARGFTLVEMLIVIVIISVLLALLIPAVSRARVAATEAKVITEIKGLEAAITTFKAKYGVEPPSQISIGLNQTAWNNISPASVALIKRIWPQFDFTMTGGAGTAFPAHWATIANSNIINMNSGECLLFFLGGTIELPNSGGASVATPTGFAKNPLRPFTPSSVSANREGPFFEFNDLNRIKDFDGNGMNEWYDPIPNQARPYLYFSSYEGRGYNLTELPMAGNGTSYLPGFPHDMYRVWAPPSNNTPPNQPTPPGAPSAAASGSQTLQAQKGQTWQIISPGYDGDFGFGGVYNPNLPSPALPGPPPTGYQPAGLVDANGNADTAAYDNLTNFGGGRLKP